MLDPMTIALGFVGWLALKKQGDDGFGKMTPDREQIFQEAMRTLTDPRRMLLLADEFHKHGLKIQAEVLRQRAGWLSRSAEQKQVHDEIFHRAMASTNVEAMLQIADAFHQQSATWRADQIRERVKKLQAEAATKAKEEAEKANAKPVNGVAANGMSGHTEVVSKNEGPQEKTT